MIENENSPVPVIKSLPLLFHNVNLHTKIFFVVCRFCVKLFF